VVNGIELRLFYAFLATTPIDRKQKREDARYIPRQGLLEGGIFDVSSIEGLVGKYKRECSFSKGKPTDKMVDFSTPSISKKLANIRQLDGKLHISIIFKASLYPSQSFLILIEHHKAGSRSSAILLNLHSQRPYDRLRASSACAKGSGLKA